MDISLSRLIVELLFFSIVLLFYPRGICCHRVSVRPSVTSRSSTKTAKRRITQT